MCRREKNDLWTDPAIIAMVVIMLGWACS